MKYIEIYLNQRQEELEKEKASHIERFLKEFKEGDYEELLENVSCDYSLMVDAINLRLAEIKKLREDLLGSDKE